MPGGISTGGNSILVVDDEVLIRLDLADYLRECGYRVHEAASAAEAIAVLQGGHSIDLVFSDVQMPGEMDGFGLAQWVRTHCPGVQVILTSGIVRAVEEAQDLCEHGPIERKPYHHSQLLVRIKTALAQARAPTLLLRSKRCSR